MRDAGIESRCKTQAPTAAGGRFSKDRFDINLGAGLGAGTVSCPGGVTTPIRPAGAGGGMAYFGTACQACPLRAQCTTAAGGRTITIGPHEQTLTDARSRQTDPAWIADYRATRPKVERKLGHLMRRHYGGRRARVRGTTRVDADFRLLAVRAGPAGQDTPERVPRNARNHRGDSITVNPAARTTLQPSGSDSRTHRSTPAT